MPERIHVSFPIKSIKSIKRKFLQRDHVTNYRHSARASLRSHDNIDDGFDYYSLRSRETVPLFPVDTRAFRPGLPQMTPVRTRIIASVQA